MLNSKEINRKLKVNGMTKKHTEKGFWLFYTSEEKTSSDNGSKFIFPKSLFSF